MNALPATTLASHNRAFVGESVEQVAVENEGLVMRLRPERAFQVANEASAAEHLAHRLWVIGGRSEPGIFDDLNGSRSGSPDAKSPRLAGVGLCWSSPEFQITSRASQSALRRAPSGGNETKL